MKSNIIDTVNREVRKRRDEGTWKRLKMIQTGVMGEAQCRVKGLTCDICFPISSFLI